MCEYRFWDDISREATTHAIVLIAETDNGNRIQFLLSRLSCTPHARVSVQWVQDGVVVASSGECSVVCRRPLTMHLTSLSLPNPHFVVIHILVLHGRLVVYVAKCSQDFNHCSVPWIPNPHKLQSISVSDTGQQDVMDDSWQDENLSRRQRRRRRPWHVGYRESHRITMIVKHKVTFVSK